MLVLSRKQNERIMVGENVTITILKIRGNTVRIGIEAPREITVVRGELSKTGTPVLAKSQTVEFKSNGDDGPSLRVVTEEVEAESGEKPREAVPTHRMRELVSQVSDSNRKAQ